MIFCLFYRIMAVNAARRLLVNRSLWRASRLSYCSIKFNDLHQDLMIKIATKSKMPESEIEPRIYALMSSRVDKLSSLQMQNFIKILSRDPANHYIWVKVMWKTHTRGLKLTFFMAHFTPQNHKSIFIVHFHEKI